MRASAYSGAGRPGGVERQQREIPFERIGPGRRVSLRLDFDARQPCRHRQRTAGRELDELPPVDSGLVVPHGANSLTAGAAPVTEGSSCRIR